MKRGGSLLSRRLAELLSFGACAVEPWAIAVRAILAGLGSITNTLIPCWACRPAEGAAPGSSQGKTQGKLDKVKQIAPSVRKPYSGAAQLPAAAFLGGLT